MRRTRFCQCTYMYVVLRVHTFLLCFLYPFFPFSFVLLVCCAHIFHAHVCIYMCMSGTRLCLYIIFVSYFVSVLVGSVLMWCVYVTVYTCTMYVHCVHVHACLLLCASHLIYPCSLLRPQFQRDFISLLPKEVNVHCVCNDNTEHNTAYM